MYKAKKTIKSRNDFFLALLAIVGLSSFLVLYDGVYPWSGINVPYNHSDIAELAVEKLDEFGFEPAAEEPTVRFRRNTPLIRHLQQEYGIPQADSLLQDKIPGYYWSINWEKPKAKTNNDSLPVVISIQDVQSEKSDINLQLTQDGNLFAFRLSVDDELEGSHLTQEQARTKADSVITAQLGVEYADFVFESAASKQYPSRTDHSFRWRKKESLAGIKVYLDVDIVGSIVGRYELKYDPPKKTTMGIPAELRVIPIILMVLIFAILYLTVIIKKLRSDEINLKHGLGLGIIGGICVSLTIALQQYNNGILELILPVVAAGPFTGLILVLLVSASDATARDVWHDKLVTLDSLRRGRIMNKQFGASVLRGIAVGVIILGLSTILLTLASFITHIGIHGSENDMVSDVNALQPFLYRLSEIISDVFWLQFGIILFTLSLLAKRFSHRSWMVIATAFIWGISIGGVSDLPSSPYWLSVLNAAIVAAMFATCFLQFDFFTVIVAHFTFATILRGFPMMLLGRPDLTANGIGLLLLLFLLIVIAVIGLRKQLTEEEITRLAPTYVKKIMERERLKRELEIARDVQLSFLPRETPKIPGLDIATMCVPATEVGGDYFDFVDHGKNRLGVVIGDVSGKGISAAFYMTLTKGFVKYQGKNDFSPKEILIRINELFYENVKHGHFISMMT